MFIFITGVLHAGMGFTHLENFFACLNIPCINAKTFKKHEEEVGQAIENVAKDSCMKAAAVKRQLTLDTRSDIEKSL